MGWGSGPRGPTRGPPRGPRPRDRSGYDAGRDDPRLGLGDGATGHPALCQTADDLVPEQDVFVESSKCARFGKFIKNYHSVYVKKSVDRT